jgi:hypothetical protein
MAVLVRDRASASGSNRRCAPRFRVARDHLGKSDERPPVERPRRQDRQCVEVDVAARRDDVLAGAVGRRSRRNVRQLGQFSRKLDDASGAPGRGANELRERSGVVLEVIDPERERHACSGTERVDQERKPRTADVLEEQRRTRPIS